MRPERIIIHHSATVDGETFSWSAIRRYHIDVMGWRDIGYHWGFDLVDGTYEVLMGRNPDEVGAHTIGENHRSWGVCLVGNFDIDPPPSEQWVKAVRLVRWLCSVGDISIDEVRGHRDFAQKSCPGRFFDMDEFRLEVAGAIRISGGDL